MLSPRQAVPASGRVSVTATGVNRSTPLIEKSCTVPPVFERAKPVVELLSAEMMIGLTLFPHPLPLNVNEAPGVGEEKLRVVSVNACAEAVSVIGLQTSYGSDAGNPVSVAIDLTATGWPWE